MESDYSRVNTGEIEKDAYMNIIQRASPTKTRK